MVTVAKSFEAPIKCESLSFDFVSEQADGRNIKFISVIRNEDSNV